MNKIIKMKCPNCDEELILVINDNFEVVSVNIDGVEISNKINISEVLNKRGIEFG